MDQPCPFRTYRSKRSERRQYTFIEVTCAILATPGAFLPISVGPATRQGEFLGASLGFSNPLSLLLNEAIEIFGHGIPVSLVLSLGTGMTKIISHSKKTSEEILRSVILDCEETERQISHQFDGSPAYLRLSVNKGLESSNNKHWHDLGPIVTFTQAYIYLHHISEEIERALNALQGHGQLIKLEYHVQGISAKNFEQSQEGDVTVSV